VNEKRGIGWIGVGNMGRPMSKRLIEAGYPLIVYNRTKEKTAELVSLGAKVAETPKELAGKSDVVFTMISDSAAFEAVTLSPDGALAGAKPDSVLIDMSTVSAGASARVAKAAQEKSVRFVCAPVSGSTMMAAAGTLAIIASGDKDAYEECLPILKVLGQKIFYMGKGEEARYMKLVLNMMIGVTCQVMAEAIVFGERAGLETDKMLEVINNSAIASPFIGYKTKPLINRDFTPAFTVKMTEKDFNLALSQAKDMNIPIPLAALVHQMLIAARATGKGDLDFSSLYLLAEELAGKDKWGKHSRLTS